MSSEYLIYKKCNITYISLRSFFSILFKFYTSIYIGIWSTHLYRIQKMLEHPNFREQFSFVKISLTLIKKH